MRRALLLLVVACSAPAATPQSGVPTIGNHARHTCAHAARGLSGATRGVREPGTEADVFDALTTRCDRDAWPVTAVDCFAEMREGDLGRCARELDEPRREAVFAVLAGNEPSEAGIAVARARLEQLSVGIEACDRFVGAVTAVLACDAMALEIRLSIGNETAQFWSLPTDRLAADDVARMSQVCVTSHETLTREAGTVGCTL
jgi:hypothetical protein